MASDPNALPESIVIGSFQGLKNTVSEERLGQGELSRAINIDIDDAGQVRRRRGQTRVNAQPHHSGITLTSGRSFVVRGTTLGRIVMGYQFIPIVEVGKSPIAYVEVGNEVFYSSDAQAGRLLPDDTSAPWGAHEDGSGRWLSPIIRPTETLGPIAGKLLGAPPYASILEAWNGRIYLANGPVIWATELYQFDYVDKTKNYLQFESDVTVLVAVDDGLYVGTNDGLYFLNGNFAKGMSRKQIGSSPVIRGSAVRVPADKTSAGKQRGGLQTDAVMLMTEGGIVSCMPAGQVLAATDGTVVFPAADDAAALHREDSGVSSYISNTRSGGGPAANARIGDYCDAEIRRATGS